MRSFLLILGLVSYLGTGCATMMNQTVFPAQEGYIYWLAPEPKKKDLPEGEVWEPEKPLPNVLIYFEVAGRAKSFGTSDETAVKRYYTFTDFKGKYSIKAIRPPTEPGGGYTGPPPKLHLVHPKYKKVVLPWSDRKQKIELLRGGNHEEEVPHIRKLFSMHSVALKPGDRPRLSSLFRQITDPEGFESDPMAPLNRSLPPHSYRDVSDD